MKEQILSRAKQLQPELLEIRRDLHRHPETGFDLTYTKEKVRQELVKMGYEPKDCGKAGLVVLVGGKQPGKTSEKEGRHDLRQQSEGSRRRIWGGYQRDYHDHKR